MTLVQGRQELFLLLYFQYFLVSYGSLEEEKAKTDGEEEANKEIKALP